jgi:Protein of unknown function (DUF1559)
LAVANYHDVHGHFPPPFVRGPDGRPWHSWRVLLLPYIEGQKIYDQYKFDEPWDGPNNRKLAEKMPRLYRFSAYRDKPGNTTTNFLAVVGSETVWNPDAKLKYDDVLDGTSETILFVENEGANIHWMEPRDLNFADMDFTLGSPRGLSAPYKLVGVAIVDGSLRSISKIRPDALRAKFTINGGEKFLERTGENGWEIMLDGRKRELRE